LGDFIRELRIDRAAHQRLADTGELLSDGGYAHDEGRAQQLQRIHKKLRQNATCIAYDNTKDGTRTTIDT